MDSKQTLNRHQLSEKMNLIVPRQLRQQFYNLYKEITPSSKYSRTPFRLKTKRLTSLDTRSKAFSRSTNSKNNLFLALNFSVSLLGTNSTNSLSSWHKPILYFIYIYYLKQTPIQNLLIQFKGIFQQVYSPLRLWIKGIPFPCKNWH